MERYDKLVRDNIPSLLDEKKVPYEKHTADQEEFKARLIEKLGEEIAEFQEAGSPEELADVIEVVKALLELPEYGDVEAIRLKKRAERGGFEKRIIMKGEKTS